jgi:hypothetical protein
MQHSLSVSSNGSIEVIDLSHEGIKQISFFVGGFLMQKKLLPNLTLWMNSGEQLKRQSENSTASAVIKEAGFDFFVYGDCVFTGSYNEGQVNSPEPLSSGWIKSVYLATLL